MSTCCGYNFCEADIESHKKSSIINTEKCPHCHSETKKFEVFVNLEASREINELKIYCPNRSAGCDWIGELKQVRTHRENNSGCPFEMLMCPHGCSLQLQRQYLASHIESQCPCYCRYCQTAADQSMISNQHKENCNKFPLSCPNTCGEKTIPRDQMTKHREKCPLELVICLFSDVGCIVKMARKDRENHNTKNTEKHLELARVHMCKMKADFAKAMAASEQRYEELNHTLGKTIKSFHTKMDDIKTELDRCNSRIMTIEQNSTKAKNDLSAKIDKLTDVVQEVQTKVADCQRNIKQNANDLTAANARIDQSESIRSIFTWKNLAIISVSVIIAVVTTRLTRHYYSSNTKRIVTK